MTPRSAGRRWALGLAAAGAAGLAGCGAGGPATVSLARLADRQEAYATKQVSTRGVVRELRNPDGSRYFVIGHAQHDLVALTPNPLAARHRDQRVSVTGTFALDPHVGRVIHIQRIAPAGR